MIMVMRLIMVVVIVRIVGDESHCNDDTSERDYGDDCDGGMCCDDRDGSDESYGGGDHGN